MTSKENKEVRENGKGSNSGARGKRGGTLRKENFNIFSERRKYSLDLC
jgi:hypothetical protein